MNLRNFYIDLKYKPKIAFWGFLAWYFHYMGEINDKLGTLTFGKEKWGLIKLEAFHDLR